jgi:hypothetical protein
MKFSGKLLPLQRTSVYFSTVREKFLILKKSLDWLAAIRKSEEYQWQWNVNLARRPSNKFSSDSARHAILKQFTLTLPSGVIGQIAITEQLGCC